MVRASKPQKPSRIAVAATLTTPGKIMRFERIAIGRGHIDKAGKPQTSRAVLELAEERLQQIEERGDPAAVRTAG